MKKVILLLFLMSTQKIRTGDQTSVKSRKHSPTSAAVQALMEEGMFTGDCRNFLDQREQLKNNIPLQDVKETYQYTEFSRPRAVSEPKPYSLMQLVCCCCYCCCSND